MKTFLGVTFSVLMLWVGMAYAEKRMRVEGDIPALVVPMETLPTYDSLISRWYKATVYDPSETKVGEVVDMLVNKDGTITAVMLSVGGFLGIGDKDVAVPIDAIYASQKDGKWWLTINATKDVLKQATGYKYDKRNSVWGPAEGQDRISS